MIGVFREPIPQVHAYMRVSYAFPSRTFQVLTVKALIGLNGYTFTLQPEEVTCKFEVGVAEGEDFVYLGEDEASRLLRAARRGRFNRMDFIVYAYYRREGGRRGLWGDLYRVSIVLGGEGLAELQASHVKGTKRIALDELLGKIVELLKVAAGRRGLPPVEVREARGR